MSSDEGAIWGGGGPKKGKKGGGSKNGKGP